MECPPLDSIPEVLKPDITFMRHQREGIARMWNMNSFILADDMGLGKLASLSEPILTPSGWSTMGQIRVGDQVISVDGTPTTVVGVFPQGVQEIVRATFSDGSWTECGWEHLWEVNTPVRKKRGNEPLVRTVRELVDAGLHDGAGNRKWFIPMVSPVEFDGPEDFPIDPYTLGALIGDGGLSHGASLTTDREVAKRLRLPAGADFGAESAKDGDPDYLIRVNLKGMGAALRAVGLEGSRSEDKFIPDEYLYSASTVRIAILQGLLDTDGTTVSSRGGKSTSIEYGTVSKVLAEQVKFIVQSLGGTASIKEKVPTYTYKGERLEGQTFYRMVLHLPSAITPFRLRRKLDKWVPRTKYEPTRSIESVEVVGREEAVCIRVDHPRHLYVTRDCIVTHNTLQALAVCAVHAHMTRQVHGISSRILIVAPPSLKRNWANEIEKFTGFRHFLVEGEPKKRDAKLREYAEAHGNRVLIMNYEQVPKHLSVLNQLDLDIVIADEAHYLKNPRARRTTAFRLLEARRRFMLTGTPVLNHVDDLWVLLDQVQPGQWGTFWGFCQHHCNTPDAPIWMADGTFKPIGEVRAGDKVIGWTDGDGDRPRRTIVISEVEAVNRRMAPEVLKVTMESGQVIKCTPDHQWLSGSHGGTGDGWVNVHSKKHPHRLNTLSRVVMPVEPLSPEKQRLMDWLCGMMDGEGTTTFIAQCPSHNPKIYARIGEVLDELGIEYSRAHNGYRLRGGRQMYANMATWTEGILQKDEWIRDHIHHSGGYSRKARLGQLNRTKEKPLASESLGPGEVVSMQTSTGNYVAWGLASKNCVFGGFQGKAIIGVKNEKQLTENLNRIMIRRLKVDVLDLPEVQVIRREVDLLPAQGRLYRRAIKDMILERDAAMGEDGEEEIATPMVRFMRLAQICSTTANVRDDGQDESAKLDAAMVDLDTIIAGGGKTVVFTKFRTTLACYVNRILAAYKGNVPVYVLSGEVPIDQRQEVVNAWSSVDGASVVVCMIQVAGVGLNMTAGRHVQFLDKDLTPANNEQAIARVHRIGQGQQAVQVYEYHARGTVEARIESLLANKKATADEVVEDKSLQQMLNDVLDEEMEN